MRPLQKIIISRTDNLGDVILTLPTAGYLKKLFPEIKIYFIGKSYTKPIINCSIFIDGFLDKEEILTNPQLLKDIQSDAILHVFPDKDIAKVAAKAKIPQRVGTSHRWWHWLYCTRLVSFSRKKSDLHEAQLNFKLLKGLKLPTDLPTTAISELYGLQNIPVSSEKVAQILSQDKINFLLHPKSKGSAREWGLENFLKLTQILPQDKFQIYLTGVKAEGDLIRQQCPALFENAIDLTGKFTLSEMITLIAQADGLLANSTGPLHIASALGKFTIGIFPITRPTHPGRWQPLGRNAHYFAPNKDCGACKGQSVCACMQAIVPEQVAQKIELFFQIAQ